MRGDAQPGARQLRGVQPGHRLQGDGGSPTNQGSPGFVDGDGGDRPHVRRFVAPEGACLRGRDGLGSDEKRPGADSHSGVDSCPATRPATARRGILVRRHTFLSPYSAAVLTRSPRYFCLSCGGCGDCWVCCDCAPERPARGGRPAQVTTRPRPVTRGRSRAVTRPGGAAITAGTALTSRMAVALSPAVLWSPSVPMSWRSSV
jgi:hypothetical protein